MECRKVVDRSPEFKQWKPVSDFLAMCVLHPAIVEASKFDKDNVHLPMTTKGKKIDIDRRLIRAATLAFLFAQDPKSFCNLILKFDKKIEAIFKSPEFQAALLLDDDKDSWKLTEAQLDKELKQLRIPTSSKVIQHARERVREWNSK